MINLIRLTPFLLVLFFFSACSTLSKSECERGEWGNIGAKDARKGYRADSQLSQHNSACTQHKIRPNKKQYYAGYVNGLRTFCTRKSGFKFGTDASEYLNTCPIALQRNFLAGYLPGLDLAISDLQVSIDDLRHERRKKSRRLDSLEDKKGKKKKRTDRIKKLSDHIDSLSSSISSRRSERNKLRAWYNLWSQ